MVARLKRGYCLRIWERMSSARRCFLLCRSVSQTSCRCIVSRYPEVCSASVADGRDLIASCGRAFDLDHRWITSCGTFVIEPKKDHPDGREVDQVAQPEHDQPGDQLVVERGERQHAGRRRVEGGDHHRRKAK